MPVGHRALCGDSPAMRNHDAFGDGKTEPGAFAPVGAGVGGGARAHELVEHVWQNVGRDPGAIVLNRQESVLILSPYSSRLVAEPRMDARGVRKSWEIEASTVLRTRSASTAD